MSLKNTITNYKEKELDKVLRFLDGPLRIALKENVAVIERTNIKEGSTVLDIGCGSGFLSLEAAKKVGPSGKVVALDARQEMLDVLLTKAKKQGVEEVVEATLSYADELEYEDNSFDAVVMSYVIHENWEDADKILKEAIRVLKSDGKVVISDFIKVDDPERNQEIEEWYKGTDPESDENEVHFDHSLSDYENVFEKAGLKEVKSSVWYEFHGIVEGRK